MKVFLSVLWFFGLCAACAADCRARVVQHQAHVPAVVLATPVYQYQPYYVASYSGLTASTEALLAQRFDALGQKLDAFTQRLEQALQQGKTDAKQVNAHPGAVYLGKSCVKCHDSSTAKTKGGGRVFFDLNQFVAGPEQQWAISKAIRTGTMPRGGPKATDEDYGAVLEFMEDAAAQRAANQKKMPLEK